MLQYPDSDWIIHEELRQEIANLTNRKIRNSYLKFIDYLDCTEKDQLAEHYVSTFDFSDITTLYLTYLRFGDHPDRGAAFLKLKQEFAKAGYPLEDNELPDFLPLVLEFASIANPEPIQKIFLIHKKAIDGLLVQLDKASSPYRWVMQGCVLAIDSFLAKSKASLEMRI